MTDKVDEIINDALGIKDKEIIKSEPKAVIPRPKEHEDIDSDYKYQRENFYNLVERGDRKSTRLNSSHGYISYAVFCLKKKKKKINI